MDKQPFRRRLFHYRRWLSLEAIIIILGSLLIYTTLQISGAGIIPLVTTHRDTIVSIEAAVLSILLIEIIGRIILKRFEEHGSRAYGIYIRTIIRIVGYLVAVVIIISILAANPALAIGIGTITGVVIGFASQNITSNVLAAGLMVAVRTVRVGDIITVAGYTGEIKDISLMYTVVSTDTGKVFVPNSMMVTTAVLKRISSDVLVKK